MGNRLRGTLQNEIPSRPARGFYYLLSLRQLLYDNQRHQIPYKVHVRDCSLSAIFSFLVYPADRPRQVSSALTHCGLSPCSTVRRRFYRF